jgi:hypothetical protein
MNTLREYKSWRGTTYHFLKAFDQERTVFADLTGEAIIALPDLECKT